MCYFTVTDADLLQCPLTLPAWTPTRFLHLKLLSSSNPTLDDNIDLERLALVGYPHDLTPPHEVPLGPGVLAHLGLVRQPLGAWNRVTADHVRVLREGTVCVLWGRDPMGVEGTRARTLVHQVATSGAYDERVVFFHSDDSSEEAAFAARVAASHGVHLPALDAKDDEEGDEEEEEEEEEEREAMANLAQGLVDCPEWRITAAVGAEGQRFHYDGELDEAPLRQWLDALCAGTLTPWLLSESLEPTSPTHPGLLRLTAHTFDALCLHAGRDVLVWPSNGQVGRDASAAWHVEAVVCAVAAALAGAGVDDPVIARFDIRRNDVPPALQHSQGLTLFRAGDSGSPVAYEDPLLPSPLLAFLHRHCKGTREKELPALQAALAPCDAEMQAYATALTVARSAATVLRAVQTHVPADERSAAADAVAALRAVVIARDQSAVRSPTAALQRFVDEWQPLAKALEEAEEALDAAVEKMRGADALSADEREAVHAAMQALTRYQTTGEADAPAQAPDLATLRVETEALTGLVDGLSARLDAKVAEVEAAAEGRVVKVHSAAELQGQLTAAAAEGRLAVIDFTAVWCGPCKAVAPVYGTLSAEWEGVRFLKADVDELEDVAAEWRVESMPTFVFVREGKELPKTRIQGANVAALKRGVQMHAGDVARITAVDVAVSEEAVAFCHAHTAWLVSHRKSFGELLLRRPLPCRRTTSKVADQERRRSDWPYEGQGS